MPFGVHQHKTRSVPELVAEVAVALAAIEIEVERAREGRKGSEGEAQRVGAECRNAVREVRFDVALDLRPMLGLEKPLRGFLQERLEGDTVNEIERIERVAL